MTYFEFVSIAISLIFAFSVTEILRSLIPALASTRRYYPHYVWLSSIFVLIVYAWISLWRVKEVDWTGAIFLYSMSNPAITTVLVRLLATAMPEDVQSFREHFYRIKMPFFLAFMLFCFNGLLYAWIVDAIPWGTFGAAQIGSLFGVAMGVAGLLVKNDLFHKVLSTLALLVLVGLVVSLPAYT